MPQGRSLIIVRAGAKSLHPGWIEGAKNRDWDLYVCPYQEVPFLSEPERGVFVGEPIKGQKWDGLRERLRRWEGWKDYDHIALADDDLRAGPKTWSLVFDFCRELDAKLAQPALTEDSFTTHILPMTNRNFLWRAVTFVEIMCPTLSRDTLRELLPTLDHVSTGFGFGMDHAWGRLLGYEGMHVFDAATVCHTRRAGMNRDATVRAALDVERKQFFRRYGCAPLYMSLAGMDRSLGHITRDDPHFLHRCVEGHWYRLANDARQFNKYLADNVTTGPRRWLSWQHARAAAPDPWHPAQPTSGPAPAAPSEARRSA
jgi:hypothetical protein